MLAPRDFAVFTNGFVDPEYQYGSLVLEGGQTTAVVVITLLGDKVLVALPGGVWNRAVSKRKLPSRALVKATPIAVAACPVGKRSEEGDISTQLRVWVGCLQPEFEAQLDFLGQQPPDYVFGSGGEGEVVPYGPALVEVAQEHFAFQTAESDVRAERGGADARLDKLEATLASLQSSLAQLVAQEEPGDKKKGGDLFVGRAKASPSERSPNLPEPRSPPKGRRFQVWTRAPVKPPSLLGSPSNT